MINFIFDMDGTFVDFYGVKGWKHYLDDLQDATPYVIAKPMYPIEQIRDMMYNLRKLGHRIVVVSWTSRVNTPKFIQEVTAAKLDWIKRYQLPVDEIHIVPYGTNKQSVVSHLQNTVLIDDSDEVLAAWDGEKIDAKQNIISILNAEYVAIYA